MQRFFWRNSGAPGLMGHSSVPGWSPITVTVERLWTPFHHAVIRDAPVVCPVTTLPEPTVATLGFELVQVTSVACVACPSSVLGDAITHFEKALTMSAGRTFVRAALGHAYAMAGKRRRAVEQLRSLEAEGRERYVPAYDRAVIYAGLNERDLAMEWLSRACHEHSSWISYLAVEPRLEGLRSDARFAALAGQVGLAGAALS